MPRSWLTKKSKPCHKAELGRGDGKISPLCAKKPRALNLGIATWTLVNKFVTCPRCIALLEKSVVIDAA